MIDGKTMENDGKRWKTMENLDTMKPIFNIKDAE